MTVKYKGKVPWLSPEAKTHSNQKWQPLLLTVRVPRQPTPFPLAPFRLNLFISPSRFTVFPLLRSRLCPLFFQPHSCQLFPCTSQPFSFLLYILTTPPPPLLFFPSRDNLQASSRYFFIHSRYPLSILLIDTFFFDRSHPLSRSHQGCRRPREPIPEYLEVRTRQPHHPY